MAALNPEIIKDTKSLISLYQKNARFKTAFDKIVANNINATYHGRPVKLYVEVLKNITSRYKQEYMDVRKIVLHDIEGKVGELFNKVNPNKDFSLLDQAYEAALKGKNTTTFEKEEIDEINDIEGDSKKNNREKRQLYEKREERIKIQEQEPGKNPENKKSYNPASQEERDRLKVALLPKEEVPKNVLISPSGQALTKPFAIPEKPSKEVLVGPSGEPIRNIYPEEKEPEIEIETEPTIYQTPTEIRQESSRYSQPSTSLPNIPNPSRLRNFTSNSKTFFRGGVKAGGVVAKGAGRAAGVAIKAGAGAAAKLGASAALGAATGGVSLIFTFITSWGSTKDLFKLIFWIVIGVFAFIVFMSIFNNGMNSSALLPPYDVPTMDSVNQVPVLPSILPPAPYNWTAIKNRILREVNRYPSNIDIYKQAAQITGIPWQVLAGIHSVEGSSNPNQSLVSGRIIGSVEPDVPLFSCSKNLGDTTLQPGEPVKIGSGCGFASLLDTAIYAGNHLKNKNNGRIPQSFEEFVFALAGYNGWGNTNCNHNTPYANTSSCPPSFPGEDHPHPMNWYDNRHSTMYIIYCSDGVQCQTPVVYQNPSVMAVVRALAE